MVYRDWANDRQTASDELTMDARVNVFNSALASGEGEKMSRDEAVKEKVKFPRASVD